jgi:hypothetical protein
MGATAAYTQTTLTRGAWQLNGIWKLFSEILHARVAGVSQSFLAVAGYFDTTMSFLTTRVPFAAYLLAEIR